MKNIRRFLLLLICCFTGIATAQTVESDVVVTRPMEAAERVIIQKEAGAHHFNLPVTGVGISTAPNMTFMASGMMMGRLFPPDMIMRNQEKLALTPRQIDMIKDEMRTFQSGIVDIQWDLHEAQSKLDKELMNDKIDEDRSLELIDAVMRAENNMKKSHLALLIKIHNVLEPAQLDELEKLIGFRAGGFGMVAPPPGAIMQWQGVQ